MHLSAADKKKLLARLARAEGQVAAIRRMVEDDTYCVDVLVQVAAARGALGKIAEAVLHNHMRTCVARAFAEPDQADRDAKVAELMDVFSRFAGLTRK